MLNLEEAFSASENDNEELLEYDYTIDENLRIISMSQYGSILGVEGDKDINRAKFKMVRFYKGFDLSNFSTRINYANANGELNYYEVKDLEVIGDFISFTWLVGYDVTAYKGTIRFIVRLLNTEEDKIINAFDTTIAEAQSLEGLDVDNYIDPVVIEDMLYHLRKDLNDYTLTKIDELNEEGQRVLATIPSDYQDTISALLRVSSMYDVITDSSGAPILDSSSGNIQSIKRFAEESEIVDLDKSVSDLQYLIEKYQFERVLIRLSDLENKIVDCVTSLEFLTEKNYLENAIQSLISSDEVITKKFDDYVTTEDFNKKDSEVTTKLDSLDTTTRSLRNSLLSLQQAVGGLSSDLKTTQETVVTHTSQIASLQNGVYHLNQSIDTLDNTLDELTESVSALNETIADLTLFRNRLEKDHEILFEINDSDGSAVLDSTGNILYGRTIFVDSSELQSVKNLIVNV